jgi:HD-like signal output (HDOD) protein/prolyl-tRNA editing enzyme YbaK/EbsC (Cys-tRNA(Pro) deacylase)
MIIAAGIKQLLDNYKLAYRVLQHKRVASLNLAASLLNIDPNQVLTVQVLADSQGEVLIVYPITRKVDFALCKKLLNRNLKVLPAIKVNRIFNDCEADCWPAIGHPYNIEIVIDKSIKNLERVYFTSGSQTSMLQMQQSDYLRLNPRAKFLAVTTEQDPKLVTTDLDQTDVEYRGSLSNLQLPKLPPVALQILQLSISKEHSAPELIELISNDPAIQQQILFYAQLPFIQDKLDAAIEPDLKSNDMRQVVEHILGFDMVSHIALGVAAGRALNAEGMTETEDFWRHAFYAATYAERITELADKDLNLDPAISYLAGLFHNFGLLLFSHFFAPEYKLLKKWRALNPNVSIETLEKRLLGMGQAFNIVRGGHAQLGEWLLRHWGLPEAICVITREHHNLSAQGPYAPYVKIIQLLRLDGIGDGTLEPLDETALNSLGLTKDQVLSCVQTIKGGAASLDMIARSFTHS